MTTCYNKKIFDLICCVCVSVLDSAMRECDIVIDKLEVLQNCFRGLVLGSGIDVSEDTELQAVVLELGQNLDDLIT